MVATLHAGFHLRQINTVSIDNQGIRGEGWTYRARMKVRHGKADLLVRLKAARRRVHLKRLISTSIINANTTQLTLIPGGLNGYSVGKMSTPWYSPPTYGESGGPC